MKKMKGKVIALFATLAFILVFVSSINVVTLFQGSHEITDISASGNNISCVPCHQWVRNELDNATYHSGMICEDCHRYEGAGIVFAEHNQVGNQAHAAYTPRCLDCHNKTGTITLASGIWNIKKADAFGDENYGTNYSAHKKFVEDSLNFSLSIDENEACIACHTNYSVKIDYSYFWNIEYQTGEHGGGGGHRDWEFTTTPTPNGTRNYEVYLNNSGAKHEFIDKNEIDCTKCHKNIYDALVNGTSHSPDNYYTHAPIEISQSGGSGHEWNEYNPWGGNTHYRYHYIPSANRATWVNNSYCYKCHNVKKYADENPSVSSYYGLSAVVNDTNSTHVHAAEALWCQTCHGNEKTKHVIDNPDRSHPGHTGRSFVDDIASNYARTFHGDICMGCHEAAVHPSGGECSRCHEKGYAKVYIESEPSGSATNERGW